MRDLLGPALAALLVLPAAAPAQDLAVTGAEVRTVSGPTLTGATVVVREGRIAAVGRDADVDVPEGMEIIDATGLVMTPGLIDARTRLAHPPGATLDPERPLRGDFRVADVLGPLRVPGDFGQEARETPAHPWLMGGITTAYVAPSRRHIVGGQGAVVKLTGGESVAVLEPAADLAISISEAPLETFDEEELGARAPTTRQGLVALLRQWLADARAGTCSTGDAAAGGPATEGSGTAAPDADDAGLDAARRALDGELPVRFFAHAPDDILTALRVAEEFGLRAVIDGAAGAHLVADELAAADAAVVAGPAILARGGGGPHEMYAHTPYNAPRLHAAGVPVALSTDDDAGRSVVLEAVVARGHGLPAAAALRAVTLDAARLLGVEARVGSVEVGKDADLVLWEGDPVGTWGETRVVIVDGEVVFRR